MFLRLAFVELQRRSKVSLIVFLAKCTEESGELDIPIILATVVVIIVVSPCHYGGEEKGDTVFNSVAETAKLAMEPTYDWNDGLRG